MRHHPVLTLLGTILVLITAVGLAPPTTAAPGGASDPAHRCRQGGWTTLAPAERPKGAFTSQDACVRYADQGGVLAPLTSGEVANPRCPLARDWDGEQSLAGWDLAGCDLSDAFLNGASLRRADLTKANLSGTGQGGADLGFADLSGADLTEATLTLANASHASFAGATLSGANLGFAHLLVADLTGANLTGASLVWTSLRGASLVGADFTGANLTGAVGRLHRGDLRPHDLPGWPPERSLASGVCRARTSLIAALPTPRRAASISAALCGPPRGGVCFVAEHCPLTADPAGAVAA